MLRVVRLPIMLGGVLGYALGALLGLHSGGTVNPTLLVLCYLVVAFGDLSTHFSNDYYDVELDRVAHRKLFGGSNLLVSRGGLMPAALNSARALSMLSVLLSFAAVLLGAPIVLLPLALGANLLGWFYSLPGVRLSYRGLGEAAIAVGTGFGVTVAGYLAVRPGIDAVFLGVAPAFVLYGFMLALCLELADMEADRAGGKMNLVARFGWRACLRLSLLNCLIAVVALWFSAWPFLAYAGLLPLAAAILGNVYASDDLARRDAVASGCVMSLFGLLVASVVLLIRF